MKRVIISLIQIIKKRFPKIALCLLKYVYSKQYILITRTHGRSINSENGYLLEIAMLFDELGASNVAVEIYQRVISNDEANAGAYYGLAIIYEAEGRITEAEAFYQKAIFHNNGFVEAYFFIANLYDENNQKEKACEYYKKVIELDIDYFWAYNNLASIYEELGKYDVALQYIKNALNIWPDNFRALFNIATIMNHMGYSERAEQHYKASIQSNKQFPYSFLNLAVLYKEKKDYQNAYDIITLGIHYNPEASFLYYNRACIQVHMNRLEEALEDLIFATSLSECLIEYVKEDVELEPVKDLTGYKQRWG